MPRLRGGVREPDGVHWVQKLRIQFDFRNNPLIRYRTPFLPSRWFSSLILTEGPRLVDSDEPGEDKGDDGERDSQ